MTKNQITPLYERLSRDDELNGEQWEAKYWKVYELDENGQRIPNSKGGWTKELAASLTR